MYPITNTVKALFDAEQNKVLRITGTDKNGTAISITDADVIIGGFSVDRYCCNGEKLEIGTAIAGELNLTLNNTNGAFDSIIFEGAELFVEIGIADWTQATPSVTYIPVGYFTPDQQPRRLSTISIKALDRMTRFDEIVDAADLILPDSISGLVSQICTHCGITLATTLTGLPNAAYSVSALPDVQMDITYRTLLQWCAGIMGCCAYIDWNGQLRIEWYSAATYTTTTANRFNSDLYEANIEITGVQYTNTQGVTLVSGTSDYALDLTGNYLAATVVAEILGNINTARNGFAYRPCTATVIAAPYLWPLDIITFTDKDGNDHSCALTNVNYGLNGATVIESKGMTAQLNSTVQPSGMTNDQAFLLEKAKQAAIDDVDDSLTQQDIFNRLTNNGEAQGIILYNGQIYINASYMNVGELNAALVRIKNLSADDISSGIIHSADYAYVQVPFIYPAADIYPSSDLYPSNGEYVTSGFAIDFETGQIYGGFYSGQISALQDRVTALENSLVYPKSVP